MNSPPAAPLLLRFADLLAAAVDLPPTFPPTPAPGRPRGFLAPAVPVRRAVCFGPAIGKVQACLLGYRRLFLGVDTV